MSHISNRYNYGGLVSSQSTKTNVPTCDSLIDLTVLKGEKLSVAVLGIISTLFPDWARNVQKISLDRVSGALTNAVFFVNAPNKRRMLLRVYGIGCDQIVDRPKELFWLARLSELKIGPALLGTFKNGRFEEYLDSTTLSSQDIHEPIISQQIAICMRRLHDIVQVYPPLENQKLEVWTNIDKWYGVVLDLLPSLKKNNAHWANVLDGFNLDQLAQEIEQCKDILNSAQSPIVFGHNDTQYGNILKLENTGELVVVDFEYSGYNPRGFDIANHFCEWMYDYHSDHPASLQASRFPTLEERLRFYKAYIDTEESIGISPEELEKEVSKWLMGPHLFWSLWGLIQASQSEIDFDYFLFFTQRITAFRKELARWVR
ncbi:kinase-like domain-containing protein [Phycomyces nitens]|nr:kinase-like domain-containing protein [Phycomyces nitens]